jgi:cation:H+ antiporter
MLLPSVAIIIAVILLFWSAGKFVVAAASLATHFKLPPLIVGMVILGFATSAPELLTSVIAALEGTPAIAIGNAYGSNITNIGLGVGLTAIFFPINVQASTLRKDFPVLIVVTLLTVILMWGHELNRLSAIILLCAFVAFMVWKFYDAKKAKGLVQAEITAEVKQMQLSLRAAIIWLIVGLISLLVSAQCLVWGAQKIAHFFAISEVIIGLTVVAVGTSLPELAATMIASRKGEDDLAMGNIIGSNLFNTLAAVGLTAIIAPMKTMQEILYRDVFFMLAITLLLFFFCYRYKANGRVNRVEGGVLLLAYIVYTVYLVSLIV